MSAMPEKNLLQLSLLVLSLFLLLVSAGAQQHEQTGDFDLNKFEWDYEQGIIPTSLFQDSKGLMWISTTSGIMSFDGYSFKKYSNLTNQLTTTNIIRIAEDIHGNVWLTGVRNSRITIDVMDPKSEKVIPLHRFLGQSEAISISMKEESVVMHNIRGKIWIGTPDTGYLYDGRWKRILATRPGKRKLSLWWPSLSGVWQTEHGAKQIFLKNMEGEVLDSVPYKGHIWLNENLDIWTESPEKQFRFHQFAAEKSRIRSSHTNQLPSFNWISENIYPNGMISPTRYGYSWSVRNNNLYIKRNNNSDEINLTQRFPELSPVGEYYIDRQGGIWSFPKGKIIRLVPKQSHGFSTFMSDASLDRSARGIIQLGDWLYVNSYKGDCRVNPDNYATYPFDLARGQGLCFLMDQTGFWLGGHGGTMAFIEPGKKPVMYSSVHLPGVNTLLRCPDGSILAGTSNGLYKVNPVSKSLEPTLLHEKGIFHLYQNNKGIWACTTDGLYLIGTDGRILSRLLPPDADLRYDHLQHLYEDTDGHFWLAARKGGLIHLDPNTGKYRRYTTSDGLSNNDIHAVYADSLGFLWLPSNYGLMRLHKGTGRIQVFFKPDGIADNEFNSLSHYRSDDGRFFFGGVNGVTVFKPEDIPVSDERLQPLYLMEARTFRLKEGDYVNHLNTAEAGKPIEITPADDYLDIRVSPLIYGDVKQIRYSWKIEGYSDNWIQQQEPLVRLYNLPYGSYTLRIRYTRQGNNWSESELAIPLHVLKPFYLRWYSLLLSVLFAGVITWKVSSWRTRQLRDANLKLEEEVNKRTKKIEQQSVELRSLDEMKSRFFANVTHELQTPLTLIIGPAENMIRDDSDREKNRYFARTIRQNAGKLLNLVEELLELSRMDANKLAVDNKPVQLYRFLSRIRASFTPYAEFRSIQITLDYQCPDELTILMDIRKWEKIINNLLSNALKFTPGGGLITLSAGLSDENIIISVEDTGMGIHPDDLPNVFDRYFQSRISETSLQGGAGIGLSLCREYIRLFGGEISVQSTVGKGSKFTLMFAPVIVARESLFPEQATEGFTDKPVRQTHRSASHTILLVEDDREMSEYIQHLLEHEYRLLVADNGKKGLQILEKNQVDLVLSDIMMPEMDGFQFLKTARELYTGLPFIMLTARADAPDRLNALRLGVDDYLTKPFVEEELMARLGNLLRRSDVRKSAIASYETLEEDLSFDQKWLSRLENLVLENIRDSEFSLDALAEGLNMSRKTLYNKVTAYTGMTPNQYITEIRLNKARQILESRSFETISEVCYAVGMKTPYYFGKLMKDRFGKAPSEYLD